jgi:Lrp/AsnC family transcriptional regulator for asnA, asnC and gidA
LIVDDIDLQIMRLLSRDCRTCYTDIASAVGISTNATRVRTNKIISNGVIRGFKVLVNPAIFGYDKVLILIAKDIDKIIEEQDLFKKVSLLGEILVYGKHLNAALFILFAKDISQDKIDIVTDLLKPATVDTIFGNYRPPTMPDNDSDFWIMKCLLSDPRMSVKDLAKETSLSHKTVARRLEKMRENNVLQMFSIIANLSSLRLVGYIEFPALIYVKEPHYQSVVERIYHELQEYLNFHTSTGLWDQKEFIFAVFFASNISTVNLILRRLESYEGVVRVQSFITTNLTFYHDWLMSEIDKRISSKNYVSLSSSAAAATTTTTTKDASKVL